MFSFHEILAHKKRGILLISAVFAFLLFMSWGLYIKGSVDRLFDIFVSISGHRIDVEIPDNASFKDWNEYIAKLDSIQHIEGYTNASEYFDECVLKDQNDEWQVYMCGNIDTSLERFFCFEQIRLVGGDYPSEFQMLVENDFSKVHNIRIGDIVSVSKNNKNINLKVSGIYSIVGKFDIDAVHQGYYAEPDLPVVFCDYNSMEHLIGDHHLTVLSVYVDKYRNMDEVYKKISEINKNATVIDCVKNQAYSTGTVVNVLNHMSRLIIIFSVFVFGICVFALVIIWIISHENTFVCLKGLGETKRSITTLYSIELSVLVMPVIALSCILNYLLLKKLGKPVIDMMIRISGNNTSYWDVDDIENMYALDVITFIMPAIVAAVIVTHTGYHQRGYHKKGKR